MHATMSEFSVRPFATVPVEDDAADLLNAVGGALDSDPRAIGAACSYDYERQQLSAIFQVDVDDLDIITLTAPGPHAAAEAAQTIALEAFDGALSSAGLTIGTTGWAIVEGDNPDLLP